MCPNIVPAKCSKKEFFCPKSKVCIQKSKHCDGKRDCPRGDDEEDCCKF